MFGALHWDYLHRQGLVPQYPAQLGVAVSGSCDDDAALRCELVQWGVLVEDSAGDVLGESFTPVFDAFLGPSLKLFGTTLIYRDAIERPEVDADVPEVVRAMADVSDTVVPQSKFLVAVTDTVVSCAVQYRGRVVVSGVDTTHADPVVQAARLLWEALEPGPAYQSLGAVTVSTAAVSATAPVRVAAEGGLTQAAEVLAGAGVGAGASETLMDLLSQQPSAAAQVCVSVWNNHHRVDSEDAALGLLQFEKGAVLSVPSWRLDGQGYVTYQPATGSAWEKAVTVFVSRYQQRARIASTTQL